MSDKQVLSLLNQYDRLKKENVALFCERLNEQDILVKKLREQNMELIKIIESIMKKKYRED